MQVWVVCFVVFFGAAELYQWLQGISLPLPVLVIAGALLAIASNSDKWTNPTLSSSISSVQELPSQAPVIPAIPSATATPQHYPGVQLPNLTPSGRSISFMVSKPESSALENRE